MIPLVKHTLRSDLVPREDRVAGIAHFAVAWTTPNLFDAVMWQATVMDSTSDEEPKSFLVLFPPRLPAVNRELGLELQVILRDGFSADCAGRSPARPAPGAVGSSIGQLSGTDRFAGFRP